KALSRQSIVISRRRIARLMDEASLVYKTKRKFKATNDSNHNKQIVPNLLNRKVTGQFKDISMAVEHVLKFI
ncbi:MAG: hypothetical protein O7C59_08025, partial [Rickettsia endosymbiont of Ixodes persulcatus]|nr:hypothetical protein [Rickettsia endosymbiont of Ixodes persulcatus]